MYRPRLATVLAVVLLMVTGACAGGDEEPEAAPDATSRADCEGFYLGTFRGDRAGPFVARLSADGSLATAFVGPDLLELDVTNIAAIADLISQIGLDFGTDIRLGSDGLEIAPGTLAVGLDAVRLGSLEIPLAPAGSVADNGSVESQPGDSPEITGEFRWQACTGSGEWSDGDDAGRWQAAVAAGGLSADNCEGGLFIGVAPDLGGLDLDLDAFCLSSSANDVPIEPIDEGVGVGETAEASVYTLEETVLFEFGSDMLTADATGTLETVADAITKQELTSLTIRVIGHTDSIGSAEFNLALSERRAEAVRADLAARFPEAAVTAFGLGETNPRAPNANPDGTDNPDGRRQNRRVEVFVNG